MTFFLAIFLVSIAGILSMFSLAFFEEKRGVFIFPQLRARVNKSLSIVCLRWRRVLEEMVLHRTHMTHVRKAMDSLRRRGQQIAHRTRFLIDQAPLKFSGTASGLPTATRSTRGAQRKTSEFLRRVATYKEKSE